MKLCERCSMLLDYLYHNLFKCRGCCHTEAGW